MEPKDRILVALDVDNLDTHAMPYLIEKLSPYVGAWKVGMQLVTSMGAPQAVDFIHKRGGRVFLDIKFKDTSKTVAAATLAATKLGVWMLTVHADGGLPMMEAASMAVGHFKSPPIICAATVLTSMRRSDMEEVGIRPDSSVESQVIRLAMLAYQAGLNGAVASGQEVRAIRQIVPDPAFTIVVPAIQPKWADWVLSDHQSRPTTHVEAIQAKADYIVLGWNLLLKSPNPVDVIKRICDELPAI